MEILNRYLRGVAEATRSLQTCWRALFRDLLAMRWPAAAARQTTLRRLRQAGLPNPPDDDLFF